MALNRRIVRSAPPPPPPKPKKKRTFTLFTWFSRFLPLDKIFGEKTERNQDLIPIRYFNYFLWVVALLVTYEWLGYASEKYVRQSLTLKREVEDLRAEYTTIKAEYMKSAKQSVVFKKVQGSGLEENLTPPMKIVLPPEER